MKHTYLIGYQANTGTNVAFGNCSVPIEGPMTKALLDRLQDKLRAEYHMPSLIILAFSKFEE